MAVKLDIVGGKGDEMNFHAVPYNAADFTGDGDPAQWTVSQASVITFRWGLSGKQMIVLLDLLDTSIVNNLAVIFLQVRIPNGFINRNKLRQPFSIAGGGGGVLTYGVVNIEENSALLEIQQGSGAAWPQIINDADFSGAIVFEIV